MPSCRSLLLTTLLLSTTLAQPAWSADAAELPIEPAAEISTPAAETPWAEGEDCELATEVMAEQMSSELEPTFPVLTYPRLLAQAELGFVGVLGHSIQLSQNNSVIDYVAEGGQDNLFNLAKLSLDLELNPQHKVVFMYQPLTLASRAVIERDVTIDNIAFPAGTPMSFLYDFPFFRASYLYDFNPDPREELAVGLSLQLRDAVIEFASLDGERLVSARNVGPVPILKFRSQHYFHDSFWWGSEVDGFYAPISILNGSTTDVIGAILDANLRAGWDINAQHAVFINLRYLGGGAVGTSKDPNNQGDGFNENWLHTIGLTLGVRTALF